MEKPKNYDAIMAHPEVRALNDRQEVLWENCLTSPPESLSKVGAEWKTVYSNMLKKIEELSIKYREADLKEAAIEGLREYYTCLHDETFVKEVLGCLTVPNTGDDQKDYENVRDQLENLTRKVAFSKP